MPLLPPLPLPLLPPLRSLWRPFWALPGARAQTYTFTNIVSSGSAAPTGTFVGFGIPSISGSTVAYYGAYSGSNGGLFTQSASGGTPVALAQTGSAAPTGTFSGFDSPSISGSTVAYLGIYNSGNNKGLFTQSASGAGSYSSVLKTGDSLFGNTVSDITLSSTGLDSSGNIAFAYSLSNGTTGIAVASIVSAVGAPEPGSVALLMLGLTGGTPALLGSVAARRRRRAA